MTYSHKKVKFAVMEFCPEIAMLQSGLGLAAQVSQHDPVAVLVSIACLTKIKY